MTQTRRQLPSDMIQVIPGVYAMRCTIAKVVHNKDKTATVTIQTSKNRQEQLTLKLGSHKETKRLTKPEEGAVKYFIANSRLGVYTAMGADNRHHASNKATKLWGLHGWTSLTLFAPTHLAEVSVIEFGELARTLRS